jgi:hypothetical protein
VADQPEPSRKRAGQITKWEQDLPFSEGILEASASIEIASTRFDTGCPHAKIAMFWLDTGVELRLNCVGSEGWESEEMNTRNIIVGLGVVFVVLSVVCGIIDDIQQKKGFIGFCASLALPLGILAILWASRGKPNNSN